MTKMWMIRTQDFRILRPMDETTLIEKLERGEVSPQDELCSDDGYWFFLSDVKELKSQLAQVNLEKIFPKNKKEGTDATDTAHGPRTTILQPELNSRPQVAPSSTPWSAPSWSAPENPELNAEPNLKANAIFVGVIFAVFIFVLIWLWSGSY